MHDLQVPTADKVAALKSAMLRMPQWQAEPHTKHFFADGVYARWLARPAGVTIVGRVHKREHLYFVVSGTIKVTTDEGIREITGPQIVLSKPGTQRAVYAVTDALCVVFVRYDSESRDLGDVEAELVEADPESPYLPGNQLPLLGETACHS